MDDAFWCVTWEPAAQEILRRIKEEATALGDHFLGTPHLLLAAVALTPADHHGIAVLNHATVRSAVLAAAKPRDPEGMMISRWGQTPRLKLAIERAMQRAFQRLRPVRGSDIWHGLLADPESEVATVLRQLGVRVEDLRSAIAEKPIAADTWPTRPCAS